MPVRHGFFHTPSVLKEKELRKGLDREPMATRPQGTPTLEVRITVDNRCQNKAIRRIHYPAKTVEELLYYVNGAKIFSKLDIVLISVKYLLCIDDTLSNRKIVQKQFTISQMYAALLFWL